jgi:hypothetical protein
MLTGMVQAEKMHLQEEYQLMKEDLQAETDVIRNKLMEETELVRQEKEVMRKEQAGRLKKITADSKRHFD